MHEGPMVSYLGMTFDISTNTEKKLVPRAGYRWGTSYPGWVPTLTVELNLAETGKVINKGYFQYILVTLGFLTISSFIILIITS